MSSSVFRILISQIHWISFSGWEHDTVGCLDVFLSCTLRDAMDFSREVMKSVNLSYDYSAVLTPVYLYSTFFLLMSITRQLYIYILFFFLMNLWTKWVPQKDVTCINMNFYKPKYSFCRLVLNIICPGAYLEGNAAKFQSYCRLQNFNNV